MIVHDIEQRSSEWYALRAGLPTASCFSKLITSKGEPSKQASDYAMTLAAEKFAGKPIEAWSGNEWTARGRTLEPAAIALYEFANDVEVTPVGFVTDDAKTMGCSPDGWVDDDGMTEVKCLKAEIHIKTILYYEKHGRCPTDYVQQTQGQLLICGRKWCDLIFYHPELPPLIIRQTPRADLFASLRREIGSVNSERDAVLAVLKARAEAREAPVIPNIIAPSVDLSHAAPIF